MSTVKKKTAVELLREVLLKYSTESFVDFCFEKGTADPYIEAMEAYSSQSKWIPVSERLPEIEDVDRKLNVLGWDRIGGEVQKCDYRDIAQMKMRFSHWQSLPAAP